MRRAVKILCLLVLLSPSVVGLAAPPVNNMQLIAAPSPDTGCYRILFDETHGFGTDIFAVEYRISGAYSQLANYLRAQGHIIEALQGPASLDLATLNRYDVLVIALPATFYTPTEKADIATFLNQGGRLVTIAENGQFPGDYRDILNDLHTSLGDGLLHNKDVVEDPTDNLGGIPSQPLIHTFSSSPLNSGVHTVMEPYASSVSSSDAQYGTAFGDEDTISVTITAAGIWESSDPSSNPGSQASSQVNGPIMVQALAPVGAGDVFAIGDANLWDSSDLDGNGKTNLEEYDNTQLALNVFAFGKQCTKCRWALFKDKDPWAQTPILGLQASFQTSSSYNLLAANTGTVDWIDPNEQVMQNWGIPYTIFRSADIPAVDLTPYCKIIVASDQPQAFYQAVSANRTWFETWVNAGGILEFHGSALLSESWMGLSMPGDFSMAYFETDLLSIKDTQHTLFKQPNLISEDEIDQWGFSSHGYLTGLPSQSVELITHDEASQPAAMVIEQGMGCVLATMQTLEWGWDHEYSRILENFLSYDNCQANYQLFLPVSIKSGP
jgi:hypothetical protein